MSPDRRLFSLLSLGLFLLALLAPFFIAALGRDDLALGFAAVAGLLALLFGVLGWGERMGRSVVVTLLLLLLVGGGGLATLYFLRSRNMAVARVEAQLAAERDQEARIRARSESRARAAGEPAPVPR